KTVAWKALRRLLNGVLVAPSILKDAIFQHEGRIKGETAADACDLPLDGVFTDRVLANLLQLKERACAVGHSGVAVSAFSKIGRQVTVVESYRDVRATKPIELVDVFNNLLFLILLALPDYDGVSFRSIGTKVGR